MIKDDNIFKICLLGNGGVGKTSVIHRNLTGSFIDDMKMTIGLAIHVKRMKINGEEIFLQIWDFAGEDRFRFIAPSYFAGSNDGVFIYDITRLRSFINLEEWLNVLELNEKKLEEKLPFLLVGNKIDLEEKRVVKNYDAKEMATKYNFHDFFECSAKTGENVDKIFETIAHAISNNFNHAIH